MAHRNRTIDLLIFTVCSVVGVVFALYIFGMIAMAECLPRDGSPEMRACDLDRKREFWLYPLLVGCAIITAAGAEFKGKSWGKVLSMASGVVAILTLLIIQTVLR